MKDLTDRQKEVFDFIVKFKTEKEYPPTIRDIGKEFGFTVGAAYGHFMVLEKKGYIKREPGIVRGIKILKKVEGVA